MKKIQINLNRINKDEIERIAAAFKEGQVIAYPTDTIYGLGCLATNEKAVRRISKIKKRPAGEAYIILVNSFAMAKRYAKINSRQLKILRSIWPGPVSAILESKGNLPDEVTGGKKTICLRLPKNKFLLEIIKSVNVPLVSTSINLSGEPPLNEPGKIKNFFSRKKIKPDLLIDAGETGASRPSSLIDITDINNIKILRA